MTLSPLLQQIHRELNIGETELARCKLSFCEEPPLADLEVTAIDFEGKPFVLARAAAPAWRKMQHTAASESVVLQPFSGFRSYLYQKQLIARKLARNRPLEVILTETAIPGFSEHHSGRAIDICTEGVYTLEESFEKTAAFAWLQENAGRFGFRLSYPRNNDQGIIFEPWHWYFRGP